MKLEYMQEFIELAEVKNYSRAAEKLFISQSTLSKHIAALEDELGVHLLNHDYRGVELTDMGIYALDVFSRIADSYATLKMRASEMAQGLHGELRIGVPYYATRKVVSPVLKEMRESYPSIEVSIVSGQPDLVHDMLLDGEIDAAVNMYCRTMEVPGGESMDVTELTREKQVLLCEPDDSLATCELAMIAQLENHQLMCFESGALSAAFARSVRARFVEKGVEVEWLEPVRNADFLSDAVLETHGGVIVPAHVASFHPELSSVVIEDLFPNRMAVYAAKKNPNPAVALFRSIAVEATRMLRK